MKARELLEIRKSRTITTLQFWKEDPATGKSVFVPDGYDAEVNNFEKPRFEPLKRKENAERGDIFGTIGDWLDEMGASKDDIAPARKAAVASNEYKSLIKLGMKDVSTPGEIKTGTVAFEFIAPMQTYDGVMRPYKILRKVHINGNLRTYAAAAFHSDPNVTVDQHHAGRGRTKHPLTTKTHPHLTPVERLSGSMRRTFEVLYNQYRKPLLTHVLNKLQNASGKDD